MKQALSSILHSPRSTHIMALTAIAMIAAPYNSSSSLAAPGVCPTWEQDAVLESPCDLWLGLDRVTKLRMSYAELDQERGCMVNRYTTTDVFAFCERANLPGTQWACNDIRTSYVHNATGRCVVFSSDCGEGSQAQKAGWSGSDMCGQAPPCPDGHEEFIPW